MPEQGESTCSALSFKAARNLWGHTASGQRWLWGWALWHGRGQRKNTTWIPQKNGERQDPYIAYFSGWFLTMGTLLSLESWGKWLYHFTTLLLFRVIQGSSNISVPHAQSVHPHWRPTETSSSTGVTLRNRCSGVRILKASRHKGTEGGTVPGVPLGVQVGASTGRQEGCDCRLLVP